MILGMTVYTFIHVLISLIGIASGFLVLIGFLTKSSLEGWTLIFLVTTLTTTLTGFGFAFHGFTPAIGVGLLSLLVLIPAIAGRYVFHLKGIWKTIFVLGSLIALYLNVFVLIAQAFLKIPALHALAPNGSEPPFTVAQALALAGFVVAGFFSLRRFRPVAS
jgi:hypothetical protein